MRSHSLTKTILLHLAENGHLLIDALIPRHPRSRLARALIGLDDRRYPSVKIAKHTISTLLCRLRKEGLVASAGSKRNTEWTITAKGKKRLQETSSRTFTTDYELPPKDNVIRLVSFDIPEKQRKKRDWLRTTLVACDYDILHKSVFIGKRPLPEEVIEKIETLGLTSCVHIVGLNKKGTLIRS